MSTGYFHDNYGWINTNDFVINTDLSNIDNILNIFNSNITFGTNSATLGKGGTYKIFFDAIQPFFIGQFLYLNNNCSTNPSEGGIITNVGTDPDYNVMNVIDNGFIPSSGSENPYVYVDVSGGVLPGSFIWVQNSTNNNGIYEVLSHSDNQITILGNGTFPAVQAYSGVDFISEMPFGQIIYVCRTSAFIMTADTDSLEIGISNMNTMTFNKILYDTKSDGILGSLSLTDEEDQLLLGECQVTTENTYTATIPVCTAADTFCMLNQEQTLIEKTLTDPTNNVYAQALWADSGETAVVTSESLAPLTNQFLKASTETSASWQYLPSLSATAPLTIDVGNYGGAEANSAIISLDVDDLGDTSSTSTTTETLTVNGTTGTTGLGTMGLPGLPGLPGLSTLIADGVIIGGGLILPAPSGGGSAGNGLYTNDIYEYNSSGTTIHNKIYVDGDISSTSWNPYAMMYTNNASPPAILSTNTTTDGQILIGNTGNPPTLSTLTAGTNISIVNGAGSINIGTTSTPSFTSISVTNLTVTGSIGSSLGDNSIVVTNDEGYLTTIDPPLPISMGGTNSTTALNNSHIMFSEGGEIVEANSLYSINGNELLNNFSTYSNGQASQSGTTVSGSLGASWTTSMVGGVIVFGTGQTAFILAVPASNSLTVTPSQTVSGTTHTIYYGGFQMAYGSLATSSLIVGNTSSSSIVVTNSNNNISSITTLPILMGGTNSSLGLNNTHLMFSENGAIVEAASLYSINGNELLNNFSTYSNGQASQSGTTVSGSLGASWTTSMVGGVIVFGTGQTAFILAVPASNTLTVTPSQTVSGTSHTIYYGGFQMAYGSLATSSLIVSSTSPSSIVVTNSNNNISSITSLPISMGGTNSTLGLNNTHLMFSENGAIVEANSLYSINGNELLNNFSTYSNGQASQSGTTVSGSLGASWTTSMIGGVIIFGTGQSAFILAVPASNSLTVTPSQTVSGTTHTIYYGGFQMAYGSLAVSSLIVSSTSPSSIVVTNSNNNISSLSSLSISMGGTNSTLALNNNRVMVSISGAIVESSELYISSAGYLALGGSPSSLINLGFFNALGVPNGIPFAYYTTSDDYPIISCVLGGHSTAPLLWNAYYNSVEYVSSYSGCNWLLGPEANVFSLYYNSGVSAGSTLSWNTALTINTAGQLTVGNAGSMTYQGKLSLYGTDSSASAGPHTTHYTTSNSYPVFQQLSFTHNNISFNLDAYYNGVWVSSCETSNFQIYKLDDELQFNYAADTAAGSQLEWSSGFYMTNTGTVNFTNIPTFDGLYEFVYQTTASVTVSESGGSAPIVNTVFNFSKIGNIVCCTSISPTQTKSWTGGAYISFANCIPSLYVPSYFGIALTGFVIIGTVQEMVYLVIDAGSDGYGTMYMYPGSSLPEVGNSSWGSGSITSSWEFYLTWQII